MNRAKCNLLVERDRKVIAKCQHLSYFPLVVESCSMDRIRDADGNEFIDFLSSASSLVAGSNNPVIMDAIHAQLQKCTQYTAAYTYNAPQIEYAEKLVSVYPGGVKAKIAFGNSGSDANDAAVKFARAYTGRTKIITFINGYHGNTYGAASLSTCTTRMRDKMGPFLPDIFSFEFFGSDVDDAKCEAECLRNLQLAFDTYLPAHEVAAVIIEPIQGDGGMMPAHPIFMKKLYDLCKANGILFISEEVQQAFYRTGCFFGIENYPGVIPDGIIMGKSIGAGLTLGAFMAPEEIMDSLPAPAHLFTLGGNALACAAGVAQFDYLRGGEFQNILSANIKHLRKELESIQARHSKIVSKFTGIGMSFGIRITKENSDMPDNDGTFKILYRAYEYGLLVISLAGNVLRIQPPLNISSQAQSEGFEILHRSMEDYEKGLIPDSVFEYRQGW